MSKPRGRPHPTFCRSRKLPGLSTPLLPSGHENRFNSATLNLDQHLRIKSNRWELKVCFRIPISQKLLLHAYVTFRVHPILNCPTCHLLFKDGFDGSLEIVTQHYATKKVTPKPGITRALAITTLSTFFKTPIGGSNQKRTPELPRGPACRTHRNVFKVKSNMTKCSKRRMK